MVKNGLKLPLCKNVVDCFPLLVKVYRKLYCQGQSKMMQEMTSAECEELVYVVVMQACKVCWYNRYRWASHTIELGKKDVSPSFSSQKCLVSRGASSFATTPSHSSKPSKWKEKGALSPKKLHGLPSLKNSSFWLSFCEKSFFMVGSPSMKKYALAPSIVKKRGGPPLLIENGPLKRAWINQVVKINFIRQ